MKQKLTGLFRGLTVVLASVLTLAIGLSVGAFANESDINANLSTQSRKFVVEDPDSAVYTSDYDSTEEMIEAKIANIKDTMAEGIVLLKNENNALPLTSSDLSGTLNIFGRNSESAVYGGAAGAGQVDDSNIVNVKTAFNNAGITINDTLYNFYSTKDQRSAAAMFGPATYSTGEVNPSDFTSDVTTSITNGNCKTAIIWLARCLGEGNDSDYPYMELDENETALISYVENLKTNNTFDKIIVILNEDNTMGVGPLANDDAIDAILHVGGLGINGTEALVDILTGETNPSGHLTDTYAAQSNSSAAAQNMYDHSFSNASDVDSYVGGSSQYASNYIAEEEGIYVGYKYYETRYEDSVLDPTGTNATGNYGIFYGTGDAWSYSDEVSYPFGYGLSYTTFTETVDSMTIDFSKGTISAKVTVENAKAADGGVAGKDVVELYAQSPYTDYDKQNNVEKAAVQLIGFAKTGVIEPGESEEVEITADLEFLASYDYTTAKTYILDYGDYYLAIGNGAHDALNNILALKGKTTSDGMDYDGTSSLAVKQEYTAPSDNADVDATSYKYSTDTGAEITNLFDDANYNNVCNSGDGITYMTRSDWSTFPQTEDDLTASTEMMKLLSGQADISGVDYSNGDYADVADGSIVTDAKNGTTFEDVCGVSDYNADIWDELLSNMSWSEMAALTQGNSITRSVDSIGYGGSIDGDGPAGFQAGTYDSSDNPSGYSGLGTRIFQSQCTLASTWNQDLAYKEGLFFGEDGLAIGYVSVWAPGCNIHRTPYSSRNFEYYSEDSMMSYYMGWKECEGMQDKGVIACPKHFAFNDQEKNRCSLVTLINEQEAREIQLRAFQGAFTKGGAMGTMTSFTRIGCVYAGCSHALLTDVLRGEWGFKGYTITDYAAWDFMHATECLQAGSDMFDTTMDTYSSVILAACKNGDTTTQAALREANKRVLYAYANSHIQDGVYERVWPWWESAIVALDVVLGVITLGCLAAYVSLYVINRKKTAQNTAAAN